MFIAYPAVFTPTDNVGYVVRFPDVPGCITGGEDVEDAMRMAVDTLGGCICVLQDEGEALPTPTALPEVCPNEDEEGAFVSLVPLDVDRYRQETDNRAVRINVSIPAWMKAQGERIGANYSQILQKGLKEAIESK